VAGVAVEGALELWASSLREVKERIRPLFTQKRVAVSAGLFLDGLLGPERRKTGWMRAEAAGDPGPWRQQAILGRGRWEADALRDVVREYAIESLADQDAVLVLDETGFLKQGKGSCGVARQYTGSAGKITNCQIGVFAAYVSRHGHAFIDRALYLPKAWTDDPNRRMATHVPPEVTFATKPRLALAMLERAITAKVPFAWVAADSVYGVGESETRLRQAGKGAACPRAGHGRTRGCLASTALTPSTPGATSRWWPARRKRSPEHCPHRRGRVFRPARGPKGRGCATGPTWSWPTLRPPNTATTSPACGRGAS
jgi:SRSO17 transposase